MMAFYQFCDLRVQIVSLCVIFFLFDVIKICDIIVVYY